jgi:hypothetical protein
METLKGSNITKRFDPFRVDAYSPSETGGVAAGY